MIYIKVILIQNTHERHSITRPWGRAMKCLFWVPSLILSCTCYRHVVKYVAKTDRVTGRCPLHYNCVVCYHHKFLMRNSRRFLSVSYVFCDMFMELSLFQYIHWTKSPLPKRFLVCKRVYIYSLTACIMYRFPEIRWYHIKDFWGDQVTTKIVLVIKRNTVLCLFTGTSNLTRKPLILSVLSPMQCPLIISCWRPGSRFNIA